VGEVCRQCPGPWRGKSAGPSVPCLLHCKALSGRFLPRPSPVSISKPLASIIISRSRRELQKSSGTTPLVRHLEPRAAVRRLCNPAIANRPFLRRRQPQERCTTACLHLHHLERSNGMTKLDPHRNVAYLVLLFLHYLRLRARSSPGPQGPIVSTAQPALRR
jgi:hypothetical protein